MEHNIEQVRRFLRILVGDDHTPVTWQVFFDPKDREAPEGLAQHFVGKLDDNLEYFKSAQSQYCGIYVGINESDGHGRFNDNIVKYRTMFADFDGIEQPEWLLKPHMVQQRDSLHGHAFWLIDEPEITAEQWSILQQRIAIYYGTDPQVFDPARVVRVAGFNHYKDLNNPAQYVVTGDNSDLPKYKVADILKATPLDATQDAQLANWISKREGIADGTGYDDNPRYIEQTKQWLANVAPPAVKGHGRSYGVIKVALYGHDHGISLPVMTELMWEHFNHRCEPPYTESEKRYKHDTYVERAYKYATSGAGCKTAVATFSNASAIPEPVGGWDANAQLNVTVKKQEVIESNPEAVQEAIRNESTDRITYNEAAILLTTLNNKSSHYDIALTYDGLRYNGESIIRCEGICYLNVRTHWEVISDDVVLADILRICAANDWKPNAAFIKGVREIFFALINVPKVANGTWLDGSEHGDANYVVFKNGMVDMSADKPVLVDHNINYFTFNSLDYDYDPAAECPNFHMFLESIGWTYENGLKQQLRDWFAYTMTPDNKLQKFGIFMGKSRGGKGVLTRVNTLLVGTHNTTAPALSALHKDHVLESMGKASLVTVPDAHNVPFNIRDLCTSTIKGITGCDPVTYDVKFKPAQTIVIGAKLIISTNNMPEFIDSSGALANRMIVFPFTKTFLGKENIHLDDILKKEIAGIAQWALRGMLDLKRRGRIFEAEAGLIEKSEIKEDMFPLAKFVQDACELKEGVDTTTSDLYAVYKWWCTNHGVKNPMTEIGFSKSLRNSDLPITAVRMYINDKRQRGFKGIYVNHIIARELINNEKQNQA